MLRIAIPLLCLAVVLISGRAAVGRGTMTARGYRVVMGSAILVVATSVYITLYGVPR